MYDQDGNTSPIAAVCARLRQACAYQRGDDDSPDKLEVHGGRLAAIKALDAVLEFIEPIPIVRNERLHIPLENLKHALLEFELGRDPTLFDRPKWEGGGRKLEATDRKAIRAAAAVAMELYMKSGCSRDIAAAKVARFLNGKGYKMPGQKSQISGQTVAHWRDYAKAGSPTGDVDAVLYHSCVASPLADGPPEPAAQRVLDWARYRFPPS